jgi:hypothetical protein
LAQRCWWIHRWWFENIAGFVEKPLSEPANGLKPYVETGKITRRQIVATVASALASPVGVRRDWNSMPLIVKLRAE